MLTLTSLIHSIIIGIVQGISEWLPISSKTQVLIASQALLGLTYSQAYTFGLFMEIGTVLAAIIYFRRELLTLIRVILLRSKDNQDRNLFIYVLVTTIITGIIGAPLYLIADSLTNIPIGVPMMIVGLVLIGDAVFIMYSRKRQQQGGTTRKFKDLKIKDYIIVGVAQGIAALPGVSRSGITTSALLVLNVEPDEAFRLSFLIGIFAAIAAFGLTLVATKSNVNADLAAIGLPGMMIAIAASLIVSLFLIDFMIKIGRRTKITYVTSALGVIAIVAGILLTFGV